MPPSLVHLAVATFLDLQERWRPTSESRANLRVVDHGPYLIRHHRDSGMVEILNRRRWQIGSWSCPTFHRAVAEARHRLSNPQGELLRNPWRHEWRRTQLRR